MRGRIRIVCCCLHEETLHRVRMNIFTHSQEGLPLMHPDLRKPFLPNWGAEPKFASCPKGKTALDQLNRLFHSHLAAQRDEQMEVVGHNYEFVKKILPLFAIVIEHFDEKTNCASGL